MLRIGWRRSIVLTGSAGCRDDLLALFRAALANAHGMLDDARFLAGDQRWPRAHALATLAWEELSKGQLCLLTLLMPEITPDYFWESFKNHEGKLNRVHMFADFMLPHPVGPVAEHAKKVAGQSRSTQNQKLRGLYVDYRKGKIQLPSQIGEQATRNQIKRVGDALAFADMAFSVGSLDEALGQIAALSGGIKNAMIAQPDAVAAALRLALQGGSQQAFQALVFGHTVIPDDADDH